jgi:hypothetical protein
MNDDPKPNADPHEAEPSEVAADELNPEERQEVSGGGGHTVASGSEGWIEVYSHP